MKKYFKLQDCVTNEQIREMRDTGGSVNSAALNRLFAAVLPRADTLRLIRLTAPVAGMTTDYFRREILALGNFVGFVDGLIELIDAAPDAAAEYTGNLPISHSVPYQGALQDYDKDVASGKYISPDLSDFFKKSLMDIVYVDETGDADVVEFRFVKVDFCTMANIFIGDCLAELRKRHVAPSSAVLELMKSLSTSASSLDAFYNTHDDQAREKIILDATVLMSDNTIQLRLGLTKQRVKEVMQSLLKNEIEYEQSKPDSADIDTNALRARCAQIIKHTKGSCYVSRAAAALSNRIDDGTHIGHTGNLS